MQKEMTHTEFERAGQVVIQALMDSGLHSTRESVCFLLELICLTIASAKAEGTTADKLRAAALADFARVEAESDEILTEVRPAVVPRTTPQNWIATSR